MSSAELEFWKFHAELSAVMALALIIEIRAVGSRWYELERTGRLLYSIFWSAAFLGVGLTLILGSSVVAGQDVPAWGRPLAKGSFALIVATLTFPFALELLLRSLLPLVFVRVLFDPWVRLRLFLVRRSVRQYRRRTTFLVRQLEQDRLEILSTLLEMRTYLIRRAYFKSVASSRRGKFTQAQYLKMQKYADWVFVQQDAIYKRIEAETDSYAKVCASLKQISSADDIDVVESESIRIQQDLRDQRSDLLDRMDKFLGFAELGVLRLISPPASHAVVDEGRPGHRRLRRSEDGPGGVSEGPAAGSVAARKRAAFRRAQIRARMR